MILGLLSLVSGYCNPINDSRFPDFLGSSSEAIGFVMKLFDGRRPLSLAFVDVGCLVLVTSAFVSIARPLLNGCSSFDD